MLVALGEQYPALARLLSRCALRRGWSAACRGSWAALLEACATLEPRLVLCDRELAPEHERAALRAIERAAPRALVVFISDFDVANIDRILARAESAGVKPPPGCALSRWDVAPLHQDPAPGRDSDNPSEDRKFP
ncbi:MAG: response regulator transcription factor [Elusimicrobia bacterium]|nr:response regulator transcription factor [Elusimicrobiota bacterium]